MAISKYSSSTDLTLSRTYTNVPFDIVEENNIGTTLSVGAITIPRDGKYLINFNTINMDSNTGNGILYQVFINGKYSFPSSEQTDGNVILPNGQTSVNSCFIVSSSGCTSSVGPSRITLMTLAANSTYEAQLLGIGEFTLRAGDVITLVTERSSIYAAKVLAGTTITIDDQKIVVPEVDNNPSIVKINKNRKTTLLDCYAMDFTRVSGGSGTIINNGNKLLRSFTFDEIEEYSCTTSQWSQKSKITIPLDYFSEILIDINKPLYFIRTFTDSDNNINKKLQFVYSIFETYNQNGNFIVIETLNIDIFDKTKIATNIDHEIVDAVNSEIDTEEIQEYKKTQIQYDNQSDSKFVYPNDMNQFKIDGYTITELIAILINDNLIQPKRISNGTIDNTLIAGWRTFVGLEPFTNSQLNDDGYTTILNNDYIPANYTIKTAIEYLMEKLEISNNYRFTIIPSDDNLTFKPTIIPAKSYPIDLTSQMKLIDNIKIGGDYQDDLLFTGFGEGINAHTSGFYKSLNKVVKPFETIIDNKNDVGSNTNLNDTSTNSYARKNTKRETIELSLKQGAALNVVTIKVGDFIQLTWRGKRYNKKLIEITETLDNNDLNFIYKFEDYYE